MGTAAPVLAGAGAAAAQTRLSASVTGVLARLDADQIATLSVLVGVVSFAVLAAITLIRSRNRAELDNARLREQAADLRAAIGRADALADFAEERLIAWEAPGAAPLIRGRLPSIPGVPEDRASFLAFGTWLAPESAGLLDRAVARLRDRGETFLLNLQTHTGQFLEALGRTAGGLAVVRFRYLTGDRMALAALRAGEAELRASLEALRSLLDAAGTPAWTRDASGRLNWVSRAYAGAVETGTAEILQRGIEFLDTAAREAVRTARAAGEPFVRRISLVNHGERRFYDLADVAVPGGSAGLAIDATALGEAEATLRRVVDFHSRTLDQLAAGVAIFGPDQRLRSYNAAWRDLFGLDQARLEASPTESEILDWLRAERKLPEQADFRSWKADHLSAYRSPETREQLWYLPDGQKLRVIANPSPQGGVTWIFENVTEKFDLETRYNALIRVQGETLDHLIEAVAVFGSDGRLRLSNPAFARLWGLDPARLADRPHVGGIVEACRRLTTDDAGWQRLTAAIAGVDESRASLDGRMEQLDGRTLDFATVPLPDGQTMVTFVDVTASVQVERALTERNEALEAANTLKNAFIQHVSYELRSPLTNIIGFSQLLADPRVGPLSAKQHEYVEDIISSSTALHAIIDDILDLATIDAGIMELDLGEVDVAGTVAAAVEALGDRLRKADLRVETRISGNAGRFVADERRIRQVLYNLLSNATRFSRPGSSIVVAAERRGGEIEFTVADRGVGMPADFVPAAFDRFASRHGGVARGGAGLGLSIVKSLVELHGGTVAIESAEGEGTTVRVLLPVRPPIAVAAE